MLRAPMLAAVLAMALEAQQTQIDLHSQARRVDFTSATSTRPLKTGTALPASCVVGDLFFKTDATAGQNVYGCTASNTWTVQSSQPNCSYDSGDKTLKCSDGPGSTYVTVKAAGDGTSGQWVDYIGTNGIPHTSKPTAAAVGSVADPGSNGVVYRDGSGTASVASANQLSGAFYCQDSAGGDNYACNLAPAIATYSVGAQYWFRANNSNQGPATLNLNGIGAKAIKKRYNQDLVDGDIAAGQWVQVIYDGTYMQMQSQVASGPVSPIAAGTALPATCNAGDVFFLTTALAGQNLYGCTAANAWTVQNYSYGMQVKSDGTLVGASAGLNFVAGPGMFSIVSEGSGQVDVQLGLDTSVVLSPSAQQAGRALVCKSASYSGASYTCNMSPTLPAYVAGMTVNWIPDVANTGAATLNIDFVGAIPIRRTDGATELSAADVIAGQMYQLWYDGTVFRMLAGGTSASANMLMTGTLANARLSPEIRASTFGVTMDGSGSVIAASQNKGYVAAPGACTITGWTITAEPAGSVTIEIDRRNDSLPQVGIDALTASAPPALTVGTYRRGVCPADCSGWGTAVAANDVLGFYVTAASGVTRATLTVSCQR